jgi:hypothetical protein
MPDKTDNSHNPHQDGCCDPDRDIDIDEQKENADKYSDHGQGHGRTHQQRGLTRCRGY